MKICPECETRFEEGEAFCPYDGTRLEAAAEQATGALVGAELGGMLHLESLLLADELGERYRARLGDSGQNVRVTVFNRAATPNSARRSTLAGAVAGLSSPLPPQILSLHSLELDSAPSFVAEESPGGPSLRSLLDERGALDWQVAVRLTCTLGRALVYLARRGLVHRGLHPNAIFVTDLHRGDLQIGEWAQGLLTYRRYPLSTAKDDPQAFAGYPAYLAPESVRDADDADERSLVYAMGTLLYEMLVGKPPFTSESAVETLERQLQEKPLKLSLAAADAGFPPELEDALAMMWVKNPERRFQHPNAVIAALSSLLESSPEDVAPPLEPADKPVFADADGTLDDAAPSSDDDTEAPSSAEPAEELPAENADERDAERDEQTAEIDEASAQTMAGSPAVSVVGDVRVGDKAESLEPPFEDASLPEADGGIGAEADGDEGAAGQDEPSIIIDDPDLQEDAEGDESDAASGMDEGRADLKSSDETGTLLMGTVSTHDERGEPDEAEATHAAGMSDSGDADETTGDTEAVDEVADSDTDAPTKDESPKRTLSMSADDEGWGVFKDGTGDDGSDEAHSDTEAEAIEPDSGDADDPPEVEREGAAERNAGPDAHLVDEADEDEPAAAASVDDVPADADDGVAVAGEGAASADIDDDEPGAEAEGGSADEVLAAAARSKESDAKGDASEDEVYEVDHDEPDEDLDIDFVETAKDGGGEFAEDWFTRQANQSWDEAALVDEEEDTSELIRKHLTKAIFALLAVGAVGVYLFVETYEEPEDAIAAAEEELAEEKAREREKTAADLEAYRADFDSAVERGHFIRPRTGSALEFLKELERYGEDEPIYDEAREDFVAGALERAEQYQDRDLRYARDLAGYASQFAPDDEEAEAYADKLQERFESARQEEDEQSADDGPEEDGDGEETAAEREDEERAAKDKRDEADAAKVKPKRRAEANESSSDDGSPDEAKSETKNEQKNAGPSVAELLEDAQQAEASGDASKAANLYDEVLAKDASNHRAHAALGDLLYDQAKYAQALDHHRKAAQLRPNDTGYAVNLGRTYYKLEQYEKAEEQWSKALERDPDNKTAQRYMDLVEDKL